MSGAAQRVRPVSRARHPLQGGCRPTTGEEVRAAGLYPGGTAVTLDGELLLNVLSHNLRVQHNIAIHVAAAPDFHMFS